MSASVGRPVARVLLQHQLLLAPALRASLGVFQPPQWGSIAAHAHSSSNCCCCCCCVRTLSTSSATSSSAPSSSSTSTSSAPESTETSPSSSGNSSKSAAPDLKSQLAMSGPAWRRELKAVRAHVFEHHQGNGQRSGRKAILKPLKGRYIADWYFTLTGPKMPMIVDDVEEERQARVELARATGGGPPKKGQGKRAKK